MTPVNGGCNIQEDEHVFVVPVLTGDAGTQARCLCGALTVSISR